MAMKIYVWGTGCGAGDLLDTALLPEQVTAFVDEEGVLKHFLNRPVISPGELAQGDYDLILVTVRDADGVQRRCRELGIDENTLFFLKNDAVLMSRSRAWDAARAVLGDAYLDERRGQERLIRRPLWTERENLPEPELKGDYVRLKTLEMLCGEIEGIPGSSAELGVFRGGFAESINRLLPERKLYLFDSFEGFAAEEGADEGAGFLQAHRNTAEEKVFARMPHPERIVLRKGFFPATAAELEEEIFALVSLDVDLEESTLAGLRFFLPRLSSGGYLLLHDYYSPNLPGVKRALRRYEEESGIRLHRFPVCDINGTLVVSV